MWKARFTYILGGSAFFKSALQFAYSDYRKAAVSDHGLEMGHSPGG